MKKELNIINKSIMRRRYAEQTGLRNWNAEDACIYHPIYRGRVVPKSKPSQDNSRKGYWRTAQILSVALTNKIIAKLGYISMLDYYLEAT